MTVLLENILIGKITNKTNVSMVNWNTYNLFEEMD